jgi:hypothetical protein
VRDFSREFKIASCINAINADDELICRRVIVFVVPLLRVKCLNYLIMHCTLRTFIYGRPVKQKSKKIAPFSPSSSIIVSGIGFHSLFSLSLSPFPISPPPLLCFTVVDAACRFEISALLAEAAVAAPSSDAAKATTAN